MVIPVSGNFVSTCTAITRSRTLTLSVSNSSGVVTSRTVIKPGPGLISASSGVSNAEVVTSSSFIARIQTIATSSSAFGVQPETQFEIISQSYSSSGGALIIDDETMVLSKCASICTASPELLARPQPKASSSGKCVTTHPINSQMEIAVQLETDSELVIEEVGTQLEFMAQGECDSLVIINVEYLEAIVSEMIAAADSVSSSYLVPRGIVTFVGAAINSAGSRTVTIPSLGNDSSEEFLTV